MESRTPSVSRIKTVMSLYLLHVSFFLQSRLDTGFQVLFQSVPGVYFYHSCTMNFGTKQSAHFLVVLVYFVVSYNIRES
jgi:hypothetical protein